MIVIIEKEAVSQDSAQSIADLLREVVRQDGYLSLDKEAWEQVEQIVLNSNDYLGNRDKELVRARLAQRPSKLIKENTLNIAVGGETFTADEAIFMLQRPSEVLLENAEYDWSVLDKWSELLINDKQWKNLFAELRKAIKQSKLKSLHAGGSGMVTVAKQAHIHAPRIAPCKLIAIFDSDKCSKTDNQDHHEALKRDLDNWDFEYYELYKREMENYFPAESYKMARLVKEESEEPVYTAEQWDFVDIEKGVPFIIYDKKKLTLLTNYIDKKQLLERVSHQPILVWKSESVNEVQFVLLSMCKYI